MAAVFDQLRYVAAGMVLMTIQPLLVIMSKSPDGALDYSPMSCTLMSELLKLLISFILLSTSGKEVRPSISPSFRAALPYGFPALIYFVNNNLVFNILLYVDATTFQLLSQLKILFTGLLFRAVLGRSLSVWQYLALWQLSCGAATSQIPVELRQDGDVQSARAAIGVALSVVSCFLSALGGIYSEKLLKDRSLESIHWQNIQLYTFGILFNLIGFVSSGALTTDVLSGPATFFKGYTIWAWAVVVNNALNGLAISAILKFADNIARVYAHTAAMLLTLVFSVQFLGEQLTPQMLIAIAIVGSSALQYNAKAAGFDRVATKEEDVVAPPVKHKDLSDSEP